MFKKNRAWGTRAVLTALLSILLITARGVCEGRSISVGVIVPLSGSAADQGEWVRQGVELAAHSKYAPAKLQLHFEDSHADPKTAITAYRNLRAKFGIEAVITYGSGVGVALTPLANADSVIQLGVATATPAYRTPLDFTFRNFPSAELEAAFIGREAAARAGSGTIAMVAIENDYGIGTAAALRKELSSRGHTLVFDETIAPGTSDSRAVLTRLKQRNPALLLLAVYPTEGAIVLRQIRELGIKCPIIASTAIIGAKDFLLLAGNGAEGLHIATPEAAFEVSDTPIAAEFRALYTKHFQEVPSIQHLYAARAFDAAILLSKVALLCPAAGGECLRSNLARTKGFVGAANNITFDRYGDVSVNYELLTVRGSRYTRER